jgi:aryl-alcohol dehydrogenase-like predicted oxidoreductase
MSWPGARGVTPGQLALAWVLAQGDDVVPIATTVTLTVADLADLDSAVPRGAVRGDRYADMSSVNG